MSAKKKPTVCTVEKSIADIAKALHDLREECDSTDRLVGTLVKGLAALTTRVENAEKAGNALLAEVDQLRRPPRTWAQWITGE